MLSSCRYHENAWALTPLPRHALLVTIFVSVCQTVRPWECSQTDGQKDRRTGPKTLPLPLTQEVTMVQASGSFLFAFRRHDSVLLEGWPKQFDISGPVGRCQPAEGSFLGKCKKYTCPTTFTLFSHKNNVLLIPETDGNFSFGQWSFTFYFSDAIFTCPGQADNLWFPSLH